MKLLYLLTKNCSHDVLNVHKLNFLVPYFILFVYNKFFNDCCGE